MAEGDGEEERVMGKRREGNGEEEIDDGEEERK